MLLQRCAWCCSSVILKWNIILWIKKICSEATASVKNSQKLCSYGCNSINMCCVVSKSWIIIMWKGNNSIAFSYQLTNIQQCRNKCSFLCLKIAALSCALDLSVVLNLNFNSFECSVDNVNIDDFVRQPGKLMAIKNFKSFQLQVKRIKDMTKLKRSFWSNDNLINWLKITVWVCSNLILCSQVIHHFEWFIRFRAKKHEFCTLNLIAQTWIS